MNVKINDKIDAAIFPSLTFVVAIWPAPVAVVAVESFARVVGVLSGVPQLLCVLAVVVSLRGRVH